MLADVLGGLPAVMISGPRASGKTTTAMRYAASVIRLDRQAEAAAFRADPDGVLASYEQPVLIDEWQLVPDALGSVKRAVDDSAGQARFLLTGSVRGELLDASWAATGRVVRVQQWGFVERELSGDPSRESFFDIAFNGGLAELRPPSTGVDLRGYIGLALRGMAPPVALQPSASRRRLLLQAYVDQLVARDAVMADESSDPRRLRRYLQAVAASTAGVVQHKTLYDAAGVVRNTGARYDAALELLFVTEQVPAWHSNRLNRLSRTAKRYVTDPALLGPLLQVDERAPLRDGDLLGRLIDTFVMAQLRPEVEVATYPPRLYHLRQQDGSHECDIIAESPDGRILGIEVKASSAPSVADARHLVWLRDQLGDRFVAGIVFHTGPRPFMLSERVHALPISALWGHAS